MKITEPTLTPTAQKIVEKRYLKTDMEGNVTETPGQMLWRVAQHLAKAEVNWDGIDKVEQSAKDFFERMVNLKFVVAGKALFEAGNPGGTGQLSSCFVLPVEDNIHSIFKTLGDAAVVHKNNGGTGFNFSKIRPRGDKVKNVPNASSGPVDFLAAYSAALSKILQGSKRQGANIGVLNADHPDIIDFITLKDEDGTIKNFNISVGVTNAFMEAVEQDKKWKLINPRNGEVVRKVKARKLFDLIVQHAWATGDPGLAFLDRMEQDNPTPSIAKLDCTNPCGEIPLLPYESCNLTSIVLNNHLKKHTDGSYEIDWEDLEHSIKTGIRLLDNMIEVNTYALPEIEQMVKFGNRRIGLGVMGFAHLLYKLGIPYDSQDAVRLSERLAKFIHRKAEEMSLQLGEERGVFPHWDISIYAGSAERYRNCALTMIAPTGTISMMANTSSGIEPVFSLVTKRKTFFEGDRKNRPTEEFFMVDPIFEEYLKNKFKNEKFTRPTFVADKPESLSGKKVSSGESDRDSDSEKSQITSHKSLSNHLTIEQYLERIAETNSLEGIDILDKKEKKIFTTTHQIKPEWHVRIQAAWQKYFDNSISKTVNFPHEATPEDVKTVYMLAWRLGCKGVTIYRDGSKQDQVLNLVRDKKATESTENTKIQKARKNDQTQVNPESDGDSDSEKSQITNHKSHSHLTIEQLKNNESQLSIPALHTSTPCPECGAQVVMSEGCGTCHECGWSQCKL